MFKIWNVIAFRSFQYFMLGNHQFRLILLTKLNITKFFIDFIFYICISPLILRTFVSTNINVFISFICKNTSEIIIPTLLLKIQSRIWDFFVTFSFLEYISLRIHRGLHSKVKIILFTWVRYYLHSFVSVYFYSKVYLF